MSGSSSGQKRTPGTRVSDGRKRIPIFFQWHHPWQAIYAPVSHRFHIYGISCVLVSFPPHLLFLLPPSRPPGGCVMSHFRASTSSGGGESSRYHLECQGIHCVGGWWRVIEVVINTKALPRCFLPRLLLVVCRHPLHPLAVPIVVIYLFLHRPAIRTSSPWCVWEVIIYRIFNIHRRERGRQKGGHTPWDKRQQIGHWKKRRRRRRNWLSALSTSTANAHPSSSSSHIHFWWDCCESVVVVDGLL